VILDVQDYHRQVQEFIRVTGKDGGTVLRDETRPLLKAFIRGMPPFTGEQLTKMLGGGDYGSTHAQTIGNRRVARDIRRVYRTSDDFKLFKSTKGQRLLRRGDIPAIEAALRAKGLHVDRVTHDVSPIDHQSQRISRGRVRKKPLQTLVINRGSVTRYIKERQKRVGMAKGGWMKAASAFGVPMKGWMTDFPQPGIGEDHTRGTENPWVRVANLVPWAQRFGGDLGVISDPVRERAGAIRTKIEAATLKSWAKVKTRKTGN
jgi:hypothetical protein